MTIARGKGWRGGIRTAGLYGAASLGLPKFGVAPWLAFTAYPSQLPRLDRAGIGGVPPPQPPPNRRRQTAGRIGAAAGGKTADPRYVWDLSDLYPTSEAGPPEFAEVSRMRTNGIDGSGHRWQERATTCSPHSTRSAGIQKRGFSRLYTYAA